MSAEATVVRVLPDVTGFAKTFDYLVEPPDALRVGVGTEVRVTLQGRRVRAWVVEVDAVPPTGVTLQPVDAVRGVGPTAEVRRTRVDQEPVSERLATHEHPETHLVAAG